MSDFLLKFPCSAEYPGIRVLVISASIAATLVIFGVSLVSLRRSRREPCAMPPDKSLQRPFRVLYHVQSAYFCLCAFYGVIHTISTLCQCHSSMIGPWLNDVLFWSMVTVMSIYPSVLPTKYLYIYSVPL